MNRRTLLQWLGGSASIAVAGCGDFIYNSPPKKELELRDIQAQSTSDGWDVTLRTSLPHTDTVRNGTLVGYSRSGELVCQEEIGDLERNGEKHTLSCSTFPAIISATTDHACSEITIQVRYWPGDQTPNRQQTNTTANPTTLRQQWDRMEVDCDKDLPPEELVVEPSTQTDTQR